MEAEVKIYELREFTYSWVKAKRWHKMNSTGAPTETSRRDIYSNLFPVTCLDQHYVLALGDSLLRH